MMIERAKLAIEELLKMDEQSFLDDCRKNNIAGTCGSTNCLLAKWLNNKTGLLFLVYRYAICIKAEGLPKLITFDDSHWISSIIDKFDKLQLNREFYDSSTIDNLILYNSLLS